MPSTSAAASGESQFVRFETLLAIVAASGIVINMIVAWRSSDGHFTPGYYRALNTFAFFTVLSNTIILPLGRCLRTRSRQTVPLDRRALDDGTGRNHDHRCCLPLAAIRESRPFW